MIQDTDLLFRKPESHGLSKREGSPNMDRSCTKTSLVQLNVRGGGDIGFKIQVIQTSSGDYSVTTVISCLFYISSFIRIYFCVF